MSIAIAAPSPPRRALWRAVETALTALSKAWLRPPDTRTGPPDHDQTDEELRLTVALQCAAFH